MFLYGGKDTLVPPEEVENFINLVKKESPDRKGTFDFIVTTIYDYLVITTKWEDGLHCNLLRSHGNEYIEQIVQFTSNCS